MASCTECSEFYAYCAEEMENGKPPLGGKDRGSDCPYFHEMTEDQEGTKIGYYGPHDEYH